MTFVTLVFWLYYISDLYVMMIIFSRFYFLFFFFAIKKIKRMARFGTLKSDKLWGIVGNYSDDCNYYFLLWSNNFIYRIFSLFFFFGVSLLGRWLQDYFIFNYFFIGEIGFFYMKDWPFRCPQVHVISCFSIDLLSKFWLVSAQVTFQDWHGTFDCIIIRNLKRTLNLWWQLIWEVGWHLR